MKGLTNRAYADATTLCERKQWPLRRGIRAVSYFHIAFYPPCKVGAERHDTSLLKFAFSDEEQVTSKIDIRQSQPDYFAYS